MPAEVSLTGWWVGYAIAGAVVLVVVVVVGTILLLASRIRDQARTISTVLEGIRANTDAMWELQQTNIRLSNVVDGARRAGTEIGG